MTDKDEINKELAERVKELEEQAQIERQATATISGQKQARIQALEEALEKIVSIGNVSRCSLGAEGIFYVTSINSILIAKQALKGEK